MDGQIDIAISVLSIVNIFDPRKDLTNFIIVTSNLACWWTWYLPCSVLFQIIFIKNKKKSFIFAVYDFTECYIWVWVYARINTSYDSKGPSICGTTEYWIPDPKLLSQLSYLTYVKKYIEFFWLLKVYLKIVRALGCESHYLSCWKEASTVLAIFIVS